MNAITASNAYAKVGIESGTLAADPHKLIAMLYQGALLAIANTKNAMLRKDIPAKGAAVAKALLIIAEGLQASLDKNAGGQLALNLDALYSYMCSRLVHANANNDPEALDEVARLLNELKGAWDSIRPMTTTARPAVAAQAAPPAKKQPSLVYGRM
ncbi:MAG: flagellar export chaperone FliS [Gammaproteobacteria bacterium]|nr:flagellar export chaperone FliS [Sideroxydans sp.]MBU4046407.1 flagellar export chaperone FliS [Gammaproteobacteria bacterium]MBU4150872.1 flagellar export chaperone FliS [Gammaproteobacteria bacterium]